MSTSQKQTWLIVLVVALGIVAAIVAGVVPFIAANSRPLHADPQQVPSVIAQPSSPKFAGAITQGQQLIRANIVQQKLPAMSVAVGVNGEIVWAEGFGWANIETKALVDTDTRFRIGHVSVPLTSAGAGLLRDRGRLHFDDEIQEYVPHFPKKEWPVTVRDLMGHTAGFRHYRDTEWGDKPQTHCGRAADGLKTFENDSLLFKPETQFQYSTYGWVLVSAAIEAAAGEPFFDFMRTQVFEPMGMRHTSPDAPHEPVVNRATSYYRGNFGNELTTSVDYSCFAGGGAFLSTPSDLVRFAAAFSGGKFLQPGTAKQLQTQQQLISGTDTGYGLGWLLETAELGGVRVEMAGHASRTIEGAATSFLTFPSRGLVVVLTSNMSFAEVKSIALAIAESFAAVK